MDELVGTTLVFEEADVTDAVSGKYNVHSKQSTRQRPEDIDQLYGRRKYDDEIFGHHANNIGQEDEYHFDVQAGDSSNAGPDRMINHQNEQQCTPSEEAFILHAAIHEQWSLKKIEKLLRRQPHLVHMQDKQGRLPLHFAAAQRRDKEEDRAKPFRNRGSLGGRYATSEDISSGDSDDGEVIKVQAKYAPPKPKYPHFDHSATYRAAHHSHPLPKPTVTNSAATEMLEGDSSKSNDLNEVLFTSDLPPKRSLIDFLLDAYPAGAATMDKQGKKPIDYYIPHCSVNQSLKHLHPSIRGESPQSKINNGGSVVNLTGAGPNNGDTTSGVTLRSLSKQLSTLGGKVASLTTSRDEALNSFKSSPLVHPQGYQSRDSYHPISGSLSFSKSSLLTQHIGSQSSITPRSSDGGSTIQSGYYQQMYSHHHLPPAGGSHSLLTSRSRNSSVQEEEGIALTLQIVKEETIERSVKTLMLLWESMISDENYKHLKIEHLLGFMLTNQVSYAIICSLLEDARYYDAPTEDDAFGKLPLHYACGSITGYLSMCLQALGVKKGLPIVGNNQDHLPNSVVDTDEDEDFFDSAVNGETGIGFGIATSGGSIMGSNNSVASGGGISAITSTTGRYSMMPTAHQPSVVGATGILTPSIPSTRRLYNIASSTHLLSPSGFDPIVGEHGTGVLASTSAGQVLTLPQQQFASMIMPPRSSLSPSSSSASPAFFFPSGYQAGSQQSSPSNRPTAQHLAINLALTDSILNIVNLLLDNYYDAVSKSDRDGRLPLHYVVINTTLTPFLPYNFGSLSQFSLKSVDAHRRKDKIDIVEFDNPFLAVIQALCQEHPESLSMTDKEGRLPLHFAVILPPKPLIAPITSATPQRSFPPKMSNIESTVGTSSKTSTILPTGPQSSELVVSYNRNMKLLEEVVYYLVAEYPEGIRATDSFQRLPLHYALRSKVSSRIIRCLLTSFSEAVMQSDKDGRFPLHYAIIGQCSIPVITSIYALYPYALTCFDDINGKKKTPLQYASPEVLNLFLQYMYSRASVTSLFRSSSTVLPSPQSPALPRRRNSSATVGSTISNIEHGSPATSSVASNEFLEGGSNNGQNTEDEMDHNRWTELHNAIQQRAPINDIQKILQDHPLSIYTPEKSTGRLPMHYAIMLALFPEALPPIPAFGRDEEANVNVPTIITSTEDILDLINVLYIHYPQSLTIKDKNDQSPLDLMFLYTMTSSPFVAHSESEASTQSGTPRGTSNFQSPLLSSSDNWILLFLQLWDELTAAADSVSSEVIHTPFSTIGESRLIDKCIIFQAIRRQSSLFFIDYLLTNFPERALECDDRAVIPIVQAYSGHHSVKSTQLDEEEADHFHAMSELLFALISVDLERLDHDRDAENKLDSASDEYISVSSTHGEPLPTTFFWWIAMLDVANDFPFPVVDTVVRRIIETFDVTFLIRLIYCPLPYANANLRTAYDLVSDPCILARFHEHVLFCGRFRFQSLLSRGKIRSYNKQSHESCLVVRATDEPHLVDEFDTCDEDIIDAHREDEYHNGIRNIQENDTVNKTRQVVIKFFKNRTYFDRELSSRAKLKVLTSQDNSHNDYLHYVVPLIKAMDSSTNTRFEHDILSYLTPIPLSPYDVSYYAQSSSSILTTPTLLWSSEPPILENNSYFTGSFALHSPSISLKDYNFCVVTPQGDCSLDDAFRQGLAANWSWLQARRYILDLARALLFLHSKGIIHGRLKSTKVLISHSRILPMEEIGYSDSSEERKISTQIPSSRSLIKLSDFTLSRSFSPRAISRLKKHGHMHSRHLKHLPRDGDGMESPPLFDALDASFAKIACRPGHSSLLPPECFATIKSYHDLERYFKYFGFHHECNAESSCNPGDPEVYNLLQPIPISDDEQRKNSNLVHQNQSQACTLQVLRSYRSDRDPLDWSSHSGLPYTLCYPEPSIDSWAFGKIVLAIASEVHSQEKNCKDTLSNNDISRFPFVLKSFLGKVLHPDASQRLISMSDILEEDFLKISDEEFTRRIHIGNIDELNFAQSSLTITPCPSETTNTYYLKSCENNTASIQPTTSLSYPKILKALLHRRQKRISNINSQFGKESISTIAENMRFQETKFSEEVVVGVMEDILPALFPNIPWNLYLHKDRPKLESVVEPVLNGLWDEFCEKVLTVLKPHYLSCIFCNTRDRTESEFKAAVDNSSADLMIDDDCDDYPDVDSETTSITGFDEVSMKISREERKALRAAFMTQYHLNNIDTDRSNNVAIEEGIEDTEDDTSVDSETKSASSLDNQNIDGEITRVVRGKEILKILEIIECQYHIVQRLNFISKSSGVIPQLLLLSIKELEELLDARKQWLDGIRLEHEEKERVKKIEERKEKDRLKIIKENEERLKRELIAQEVRLRLIREQEEQLLAQGRRTEANGFSDDGDSEVDIPTDISCRQTVEQCCVS